MWWKEEGALLSLSLSQIDKRDLSYLAGTRVSGTRNSTVILSDKFSLYFNLNDISYTHVMVNHSENFVDPYTEAHSNTTEGVWNAVGYPSEHWNSDLIEFWHNPSKHRKFWSYPSKHWNFDLIVTLALWFYSSKLWNSDLIFPNIGIVTLSFQTLELGPSVITDRTFIRPGFEMFLQMGPLLRLGPVITLVAFTRPSDRMRKKFISKVFKHSLKFIRLLQVVFSSQQGLNRPVVNAIQWHHSLPENRIVILIGWLSKHLHNYV